MPAWLPADGWLRWAQSSPCKEARALLPAAGIAAHTPRPRPCLQHFPERIQDIFMYEAPTIFWGLWVSG